MIKAFGMVVGVVVLVVVCAFLVAIPVMLLWNWLIPDLFVGMHTINLAQAWGLACLSGLLFKSTSSSSSSS